jgi:hypothetical protein
MYVALREVKEVDRVAYSIAAQPFSAQDRIFECDREGGTIRTLGAAFLARAELSTVD